MSRYSGLPADGIIAIRPSDCRYSRSRIIRRFKCGRLIAQVYEEIKSGMYSVAAIPQMEVLVDSEGVLWTMNNRRLALFQKLESHACLASVNVRIVRESDVLRKLATEDFDGRQVLVRGTGEIINGRRWIDSFANLPIPMYSRTMTSAPTMAGESHLTIGQIFFSHDDHHKSGSSILGVILRPSDNPGHLMVRFTNDVNQEVPTGWVERVMFQVRVGDLVTSHYRLGGPQDLTMSPLPAEGYAMVSKCSKNGDVTLLFPNGANQEVPAWYVTSATGISVGDRVKFKEAAEAEGTITAVMNDQFQIVPDVGNERNVPLAQLTDLIREGGWASVIEPGSIVKAHFRVDEGTTRSSHEELGVVLENVNGNAHIRYDNDTQFWVPSGWIVALMCTLHIGDFVQCHFRDNSGKKTPALYGANVQEIRNDGNVVVMFANDSKQVVPAWWATAPHHTEVGDRVSSRFRSGGPTDAEVQAPGTLTAVGASDMTVHFDNGAVQNVPLSWLRGVTSPSSWRSSLQPHMVVTAYFIKDMAAALPQKSDTTYTGVILSVGSGTVRIRFDNEVTQDIPTGWLEQRICTVLVGDFVMAYFKDGANYRSATTFPGSVQQVAANGDVVVLFTSETPQTIPAWWVTQAHHLGVGDRVQSYYIANAATGAKFEGPVDERSLGTICAVNTEADPITVNFDVNGAEHIVPRHWIRGVVEKGMVFVEDRR